MSGIHSYETVADGSDIDEVWYNEIAVAQGRIAGTSINPAKGYDYIIWRSGAVYYAQNGITGVVTSNAACHTLTNGLLNDNISIYFMGGRPGYVLTGAIDFADHSAASIHGNPRLGSLFEPADTINAFEFDESWNCVLEGIKIDGGNQATSGMGIMFTEATGTNYARRNIFRDIEFRDCYQGIGDLGATTNGGVNNLFEDLRFYDTTFAPIKLSVNAKGLWHFNRIHIDQVTTQATDSYLMDLSNFDGVHVNNLTILTGGATSLGAFHIEDSDKIWMNNINMENAGQDLLRFENCTVGNISNLRAASCGLDGGGNDQCLRLLGCRDFNFSNFDLRTTSVATSEPLTVASDGATESARIRFMNGGVSGSTGNGCVIANASTYIQFKNVDFFNNTLKDMDETGTTNYNSYQGCTFQSGNTLTFIGANNVYDKFVTSYSSFDLSGGATDEDIFYASIPCNIVGYYLFYTEASSADVDWPVDAIRIGRTQDGVANDDDYFDETISEASKNLGYSKFFNQTTLTNMAIAVGDTVTVGTGGGKTGTGEIRVILSILENAS